MWNKIKNKIRRRKEPVRLNKKVTLAERIQNWTNKYYGYLLLGGIIVAILLFVHFCFVFVPGTESGIVYNNRTGLI